MLLRVFSFLLTIGVKHFTGKPHLGWAERVVRGKYKSCGEYAPFKWCPFRAPVMYSCCICDIQCNAYTCTCRAISRKIVGKIVHMTILKGNMGCNQYTVPDTTIVVRKHMSMVSRPVLSNFFEEEWTQNHPQYLLGLSHALLTTTFLKIAVYRRKTSHEGAFKMSRAVWRLGVKLPKPIYRKLSCFKNKSFVWCTFLNLEPMLCLYLFPQKFYPYKCYMLKKYLL